MNPPGLTFQELSNVLATQSDVRTFRAISSITCITAETTIQQ
jgi:hypothetical protein